MPWLFFFATLPVAIITGFAVFSQGAAFKRASGQVIQGIFSIICFGLIGWAFWKYGWKAGLVEVLVIFIGANIGQSILNALIRR